MRPGCDCLAHMSDRDDARIHMYRHAYARVISIGGPPRGGVRVGARPGRGGGGLSPTAGPRLWWRIARCAVYSIVYLDGKNLFLC